MRPPVLAAAAREFTSAPFTPPQLVYMDALDRPEAGVSGGDSSTWQSALDAVVPCVVVLKCVDS